MSLTSPCFFSGFLRELKLNILVFLKLAVHPYEKAKKGFALIIPNVQYFYIKYAYQRCGDMFERPIASVPGSSFEIMERYSDDGNATFKYTGKTKTCLNMGSYNYLGFAQTQGPVIEEVLKSVPPLGFAVGSPRNEGGNYDIIQQLEIKIAQYVKKPAAVVYAMGFATNSTTLPIICQGKGNLIISDSLNHNSIVTGSRDAEHTRVIVFKHNEPEDLEKKLRAAIVQGQPRTRRPWNKIFHYC